MKCRICGQEEEDKRFIGKEFFKKCEGCGRMMCSECWAEDSSKCETCFLIFNFVPVTRTHVEKLSNSQVLIMQNILEIEIDRRRDKGILLKEACDG